MCELTKALEERGASAAEAAFVASFESGVSGFYEACADPSLLLKIASVAAIDPRRSLAIAVEASRSVLHYVGPREPRPRRAVDVAALFLSGSVTSAVCASAAQSAEDVARAYRHAKSATRIEKRAFRAGHHAALAAAKTALIARDAAITTELAYDDGYTFDDAWSGVRTPCALAAGAVLASAIEAACSATAARFTIETGSIVAGTAAADEARPLAQAWAARLVRKHLPTAAISVTFPAAARVA